MSELKSLLRGAATIFDIFPAPSHGSSEINRHFRDLLKQGMSRNSSKALDCDMQTLGQDLGDDLGKILGLKRDQNGFWNRIDGQPLKPMVQKLKPQTAAPKS